MFFNPGQWLIDVVVGWVTGMANFIATIIASVFAMDSTTSTGQPQTADLAVVQSVGTIVLVLALPLTVAAVIWQVIRSSAEGRLLGVGRAILGGILMVVLSRFVFWYGPQLISGFDDLTTQLIFTFNSAPGGIVDSLLTSFGLHHNLETGTWEPMQSGAGIQNPTWMAVGSAATTPGGSVGVIIVALILLAIIAFGAFLLMVMLAFRRWAMIVMLSVAPLALMFLPAEKASKAVGLKWLQIFLALLAAKPLAAIILAISSRMLIASGSMNIIMFGVALISFIVAAATPLIAMKFFGFLGVEIGHAYAQAAGEGALRGGLSKATNTSYQLSSLSSSARRLGGSGRGGGRGPACGRP